MHEAFPPDPPSLSLLSSSSAIPERGRQVALPIPLTPLIGRAGEVAAAGDALQSPEVRLITLTGPGGVGKSRVAIQAAAEFQAEFADGTYLIRLATLGDADLLLPTIARAVGLPDPGTTYPIDALRSGLEGRQTLLLLDSFDPIMSAAPLLADLLRSCPELTALVTCRSRLRVRGERVQRIAPLATPTEDEASDRRRLYRNPAVQLFMQHAEEIVPGFALNDENAAAIVEIVRRLDGLPLAIELAAARLSLFSPEALLARLERRLPLLRGGPADLPDRLQTLHGAIAWSYDLLPTDEQCLFRCLSVFAGGFPWDAVPIVCAETPGAEVLDGVASLLDKSLLVQETGSGHEPRSSMLETIREFGLEQLEASGEATVAFRRHAEWCLDRAERAAAARMEEGGPSRWLDWLDLDHDDLRAACTWLEETGDSEGFLQLTAALGWFWLHRSHRTEGRRWLGRAIARARQDGIRTIGLARALDGAAVLACMQGAYEEAEALGVDYLALSEELGDAWGTAAAYNLLGAVARATGAFDRAAEAFTQALTHFQHQDLNDWVALALLNLGTVSYWKGDGERATALISEALGLFREQADGYGTAVALSDLGLVTISTDQARAARLFNESLDAWRPVGTKEGLVDWLARVASLAVATHRPELGVRLFGAVERNRASIGYSFELPERARQQQLLKIARERLDAAAFAAALEQGQEWSLEEALTQGSAFLETVSDTTATDDMPESSTPFGLTPRELDVLRQLVDGRSDRQIGDALSISHRTVMRHVEHILAKLEVDSRTAAATQAVRLGIF